MRIGHHSGGQQHVTEIAVRASRSNRSYGTVHMLPSFWGKRFMDSFKRTLDHYDDQHHPPTHIIIHNESMGSDKGLYGLPTMVSLPTYDQSGRSTKSPYSVPLRDNPCLHVQKQKIYSTKQYGNHVQCQHKIFIRGGGCQHPSA